MLHEATKTFWAEMESLMHISPYPLAEGTKYLGLFLKPNGYISSDWQWLLQRFEHKIKCWDWRWLSIGGCLTLAQDVLSNMVVFWFSLCKVPKFIIKKIGIMIMAFIWFGEVKQSKYHLVRWEAISRLVGNGGWGMKDMYLFYFDLRAKSLW